MVIVKSESPHCLHAIPSRELFTLRLCDDIRDVVIQLARLIIGDPPCLESRHGSACVIRAFRITQKVEEVMELVELGCASQGKIGHDRVSAVCVASRAVAVENVLADSVFG